MDRQFLVMYGDQSEIVNQIGLQNILNAILFKNHDCVEFYILEIDSRLTKDQSDLIGNVSGYSKEIEESISNGSTPYEAVKEWLLK